MVSPDVSSDGAVGSDLSSHAATASASSRIAPVSGIRPLAARVRSRLLLFRQDTVMAALLRTRIDGFESVVRSPKPEQAGSPKPEAPLPSELRCAITCVYRNNS